MLLFSPQHTGRADNFIVNPLLSQRSILIYHIHLWPLLVSSLFFTVSATSAGNTRTHDTEILQYYCLQYKKQQVVMAVMARLKKSPRLSAVLFSALLWHFTLVGAERGTQRKVLLHHQPSSLTYTPHEDRPSGQQQVENYLEADFSLGHNHQTISQKKDEEPLSLRPTTSADAQTEAPGAEEVEERCRTTKCIVKSKYKGVPLIETAQDIATWKTGTKSNIINGTKIQEELYSGQMGPESRSSSSTTLSQLVEELTTRRRAVLRHLHRQRRDDTEVANGDIEVPRNSYFVLCDHPPRKFSPSFNGHSNVCADRQDIKTYSFNTYKFCFDVYSRIWNKNLKYYPIKTDDNTEYRIYTDRDYISICLPLLYRFNHCKVHKFLTICSNNTILIDPYNCPVRRNREEYFISMVFWNYYDGETDCLEKICDGTYEVIVREVNGVKVMIENLATVHEGITCWQAMYPLNHFKYQEKKVYITNNIHWPCCYTMYRVTWARDPGEHGLHGGWSYLPGTCLAGEVALVVMVAGVAISGVVGNLLVVTVMVRGAHRGQPSGMLRMSLAFSNLLISLFVVVPSLYYHLVPFLAPPHISIWESGNIFIFADNFLTVDKGLPVFQGVLYGVCSIVCLMTTFILSVERLILTWRPLRYRDYFTVPRIKVFIALTWMTATLHTLILIVDEDGDFSTTWDTILKLPLGINSYKWNNWIYSTNIVNLLFLTLMCISSITFSVIAIINFVREQVRVTAEWRALEMRVSGPIREENIRIVTSQLIITHLFLLSVFPMGVAFVASFTMPSVNALHTYLSLWLFLASTGWNPWIYNMRSQQFQQDVRSTLQAVKAMLTQVLCCVYQP
ncbi:uncharacterized protein [Panulirus ornatus]|uniref:uncharacterized protein n=1 Tax=Panulirus ornatus TaxID=150431 RepID=UPI003A84E881